MSYSTGSQTSFEHDEGPNSTDEDQGDVVDYNLLIFVGVGDDVNHGISEQGSTAQTAEDVDDGFEGVIGDASLEGNDAYGAQECGDDDAESGHETVAPGLRLGEASLVGSGEHYKEAKEDDRFIDERTEHYVLFFIDKLLCYCISTLKIKKSKQFCPCSILKLNFY